jgi:hypothetical protein
LPTYLFPVLALCLAAAGETEVPPFGPVLADPARVAAANANPADKETNRRWPSFWLFRPDALAFVPQTTRPVKNAGMAVLHKVDVGAAKARDGAKWLGRETLDHMEVMLDGKVVDCILFPIGLAGKLGAKR